MCFGTTKAATRNNRVIRMKSDAFSATACTSPGTAAGAWAAVLVEGENGSDIGRKRHKAIKWLKRVATEHPRRRDNPRLPILDHRSSHTGLITDDVSRNVGLRLSVVPLPALWPNRPSQWVKLTRSTATVRGSRSTVQATSESINSSRDTIAHICCRCLLHLGWVLTAALATDKQGSPIQSGRGASMHCVTDNIN